MTQFKEKSHQQKAQVSVGLFDYPALMVADMLLYDTDPALLPCLQHEREQVCSAFLRNRSA
jgi:tryptophanyl-tRNA synthetase